MITVEDPQFKNKWKQIKIASLTLYLAGTRKNLQETAKQLSKLQVLISKIKKEINKNDQSGN